MKESPWKETPLLRGLLLFLLLTVIGFSVLVIRGRTLSHTDYWQQFPISLVLIALSQSILDLAAGGLRLWILLKAFSTPVSFWRACVANAGNILLGALTPSQTGGGVAQLYVLYKGGVPLPVAIIASWVSFLGTIIVLLCGALWVQTYESHLDIAVGWRVFSKATLFLFVTTLVVFVLAIPNPKLYEGRLVGLCRKIPWVSKPKILDRVQNFETTIEDFGRHLRQSIRKRPGLLALGLGISGLIYINKFLIAFTVLRGMGVHTALSEVLYLQEIQYLVTYFAPTPGASGVAEMSAGNIMGGVLPADGLVFYLLLWRTFSLHIPMLLGALVLFGPLAKRNSRLSVSGSEPTSKPSKPSDLS